MDAIPAEAFAEALKQLQALGLKPQWVLAVKHLLEELMTISQQLLLIFGR